MVHMPLWIEPGLLIQFWIQNELILRISLKYYAAIYTIISQLSYHYKSIILIF